MMRIKARTTARRHKKTLEKGEYLQGSNALSSRTIGPAQGGEAGGT
jgi:hypothetical protein